MRMLKRLSGAQDTKKMMVTVISIRLVFFLRSIWRDLRWEERGRLLCLVSFWQTLHTADMETWGPGDLPRHPPGVHEHHGDAGGEVLDGEAEDGVYQPVVGGLPAL